MKKYMQGSESSCSTLTPLLWRYPKSPLCPPHTNIRKQFHRRTQKFNSSFQAVPSHASLQIMSSAESYLKSIVTGTFTQTLSH